MDPFFGNGISATERNSCDRKSPDVNEELKNFAQAHAHEIADSVPVGIAIADSQGRLVFANAELERMTGYARGELLGQNVDALVPLQHRHGHARHRDSYAEQPSERRMGFGRELHCCRRDGSEFPVEIGLRPLLTGEGAMTIATMIDVSERQRMTASFRAMFEAAPYGMLLSDGSGRISMANRQLCEMFGYRLDELINQPVELLVPPRHQTAHVSMRRQFHERPIPRAMGRGRDVTGQRKDGREVPVEISLTSVDGTDGLMALAAVVDISQRKRAELKLREANAQLEEFTYVSSHDLKSPIRGISNLLEWVREDLGDTAPESVRHNLDRMALRVERMERLIEDLLSYARSGQRSNKVECIDLPSLINEIIELEPRPSDMHLELDLQIESLETAATPLTTVLRNLYSNAIKHHDKPDGRIRIEAREHGSHCRISVIDNGPGVPAAARERVFRLFQTLTASERMGSGLGLAVAKRLAESHGGRIELNDNEPEPGCRFDLWWPRFDRSDLNE